MKKTYQGLHTRRMVVECQPLMANSNQKIKAKTKVHGTTTWSEEGIVVEEFGMTDINGNLSDITTP